MQIVANSGKVAGVRPSERREFVVASALRIRVGLRHVYTALKCTPTPTWVRDMLGEELLNKFLEANPPKKACTAKRKADDKDEVIEKTKDEDEDEDEGEEDERQRGEKQQKHEAAKSFYYGWDTKTRRAYRKSCADDATEWAESVVIDDDALFISATFGDGTKKQITQMTCAAYKKWTTLLLQPRSGIICCGQWSITVVSSK